MNKKIKNLIFLITIAVLILGIGGYFLVGKKANTVACTQEAMVCPDGSSVGRHGPNCEFTPCPTIQGQTIDWKIYRNDTYGFELKYPSSWFPRDGRKDWKPVELNDFYQFCNKVITNPSGPLDTNANFIGSCEGQFLRVNIWKVNTDMKIITSDFATLKLDVKNKITIGGKSASEFIYSGPSQILGGVHTWDLFIVSTNDFIYSINGDSCMDNQTECNQIISTFKFNQLINSEGQQSCNNESDCACGVNIETKSCFLGNKKYVDTTKQCPDFCGGIAGNLTTKCIDSLCKQVSNPQNNSLRQEGETCGENIGNCQAGLKCAYPCGIPGCQNVCLPENEPPRP